VIFGVREITKDLMNDKGDRWSGPLFTSELISIGPETFGPEIILAPAMQAQADVMEELVSNGGCVYDAVNVLLNNVYLTLISTFSKAGGIAYGPEGLEAHMKSLLYAATRAVEQADKAKNNSLKDGG